MVSIQHIHPLHWYAGMKWSKVQVMLHATGIGQCDVELVGEGVSLAEVVRPENNNYLLLYIETAGAAPQTITIRLTYGDSGETAGEVAFELRQRTHQDMETFDAHDVVYLLMPDRWADGTHDDPEKKRAMFEGMADDRWNPAFDHTTETDGVMARHTRHGGDLAGMTAHLDYLQDLGVTTVWPTPLMENDNDRYSYHGYTITDYYRVDPRFGTLDDYCHFVTKAHEMGLKVILDMVVHHCSAQSFLYADKVDSAWFSTDERQIVTNFRPYAQSDPYLSDYDKQQLTDGCFFITSATFNGYNAQVQDYVIQNGLWWVEMTGANGIRLDSYPYNHFEAMNRWCMAMKAERPGMNIVGETFMSSPVAVSYWQQDSPVGDRQSLLPSVMDFPLNDILQTALDEETDDWETGLTRVQKYLGDDRIYAHPDHLMTFLSNHDINRFVKTWDEGHNNLRYKQALTLLLTIRGIPQLYYGDEVCMSGCSDRYDWGQRQNFPGGFPGDETNAFEQRGLSERQREYYEFTRLLLNWRREPAVNRIIAEGRFIHHVVSNGIYVYARELEGKMITVMLNGTWEEHTLETAPYADVMPADSALEVITQRRISIGETLTMNQRDIFILDWT